MDKTNNGKILTFPLIFFWNMGKNKKEKKISIYEIHLNRQLSNQVILNAPI